MRKKINGNKQKEGIYKKIKGVPTYLNEKLLEYVESEAKELGLSNSTYIRMLILECIKKNKGAKVEKL